MVIIAMTTNSSIRVNAFIPRFVVTTSQRSLNSNFIRANDFLKEAVMVMLESSFAHDGCQARNEFVTPIDSL
jgi:hypothetical protein